MNPVDTFSDDFRDAGLPPHRDDVGNIVRNKRVDYLGDTHGNYEGFLFNMRKLELIDSHGDWIGGADRVLVLLGDIYGDRHTGSFETALHIQKLQKQGASIVRLAGNHEDTALAYFDCLHTPSIQVREGLLHDHLFSSGKNIEIYLGLWEFGEFVETGGTHDWMKFLSRGKPTDILKKMRKDKKGQEILTSLCGLQIGQILDDTLFIHTDPVDAIVDMLDRHDWDIEKINSFFKTFLVNTLLKGKLTDKKNIDTVNQIREAFLSMHNRRRNKENVPMLSHSKAAMLSSKLKVSRIIHGHTNHRSQPTYYCGGIEITSADHSSFKFGNRPPFNASISAGSILRNGHRIEPKD